MEYMNIKKCAARILSALVLCSWTAVSLSAEQEIQAKDDYQVFIQKGSDSTPDFYYAFHKTNITGGTVYSEGPSDLYKELQDKRKEVSLDTFPALKRSASLSDRATKFTRLFVSKDETALLATLNNQADSAQKKLVVSAKVPQKVGGYCTGSLTFFVTQKDDKLSIKVSDQRKCMRSGSEQANLARTAESGRKRDQKKQEREANAKIEGLMKQLNAEKAKAENLQKEVKQFQQTERVIITALATIQEQLANLDQAHKDELQRVQGASDDKQQERIEKYKKTKKELESKIKRLIEEQGAQRETLERAKLELQEAREREQKAKQDLEAEQRKPLEARITEAGRGAMKSLGYKLTRKQ